MLQVAHKASTRARQRCRSAETRSRRPHVQPFSFISLSTVLLQVSLGRPLFLWPSGVHRRAILVKAVVCWRSTCPIHHQRLRLTWMEMETKQQRDSKTPGSCPKYIIIFFIIIIIVISQCQNMVHLPSAWSVLLKGVSMVFLFLSLLLHLNTLPLEKGKMERKKSRSKAVLLGQISFFVFI